MSYQLYYRGFRDILPEDIVHNFSSESSNIIGNSVGYFSIFEATATSYGFNSCVKFGVTITYQYKGSDPLLIHEGKDFKWENRGMKILSPHLLDSLKTNFLEKDQIADRIFGLGYDAVSIISSHDKSDDLIAIKNLELIIPVSISVATKWKDPSLLKMGELGNTEEMYDLIYGKKPFDYFPIYNISIDQISEISDLLRKGSWSP